jgi:glycosyltransferase involved in cell wall biosynthesis
MKQASVVFCTHDPRPDYLRRALNALERQTLPRGLWELVVVDNASVLPAVSPHDVAWHPAARIVREDVLGLTPARIRGISETDGALVTFVDDDNLLAPDYLERAVELHARFPQLGTFGAGSLEAEFESPPPPEIHRYLPLLAVRSVAGPRWSNQPGVDAVPWGAGLVVARSIADRYEEFVEHLRIGPVLDRRGAQLNSGGDDLFSWLGTLSGFGFGIFPQLRITHLINQDRVRRSYVLRLIHDHSFSAAVRRCVLTGEVPRRLGIRALVRIGLHGLRRGPFSMRCRWAASTGAHRATRFLVEEGLLPGDGRSRGQTFQMPEGMRSTS